MKIKRGIILLTVMVVGIMLYVYSVNAGLFINSSHGNSTYGVYRTSIANKGYSRGNCTHCHEQHASIDNAEPDPASGSPSNYALFYDNYINQTDGVCLQCHTEVGSYQQGGLVNRSYSYRAGGWTNDTLNDIEEAFTFSSTSTPPGTSHHLDDIRTFITGKWGYTADSNPCVACHNPHAATGDPANAPNSPKSAANRGYPISRPSMHSKDSNAWGVWGDAVNEKMNSYTANYQAPYRYNSTTSYEPDGSTVQDGSNLTDFVSFCTDCHNTTYNSIYSTPLGRNLRTIDWANEKHGQGAPDRSLSRDAPYGNSTGLVLSCTDCHEPHGSTNQVLIRPEVNGGTLSGTITTIYSPDTPTTRPFTDSNKEIGYLCQRCHMDDYDYNTSCQPNRWYYAHHATSNNPYTAWRCWNCHPSGGGPPSCNTDVAAINCNTCHFHGATISSTNNGTVRGF